ncbi:PAS domain-containing protein [Rhizobium bangladeshense]|uniref:PAS domain-containing protein n=1 Tax=Rhizobium bangladeshense TaxID=1138189 RepID=UPI0021B1173A|nr:PAS domain-containing protein [Rhizobium bangladeshense]
MLILHASASPALVVEAPGRRVVFANPAANALFGPSEIRQWPLVAELITGWDASKASFPASIRRKAGGWSPCNISLIPLSGEDRDLDVVLISEHSLEHDLEEAKQRLQFVIDMLPQAICLFDHDDRYVLWNKKSWRALHRHCPASEARNPLRGYIEDQPSQWRNVGNCGR